MSKVLILGAAGILGRALNEAWSARYAVEAWDKEELDITDQSALKQKVEALSPGLVINATAHNAVDLIEEDDEHFALARLVNGVAVGNLAAVCQGQNIPLIHFSSDYVFSGKHSDGYQEHHQPEQVNKYGQTKLIGEKAVQEIARKYYLIRLSRLFGQAGVGESSKQSFVQQMLDRARGGGVIQVVDSEISSPTYSSDLAKLTLYIFENQLPWGIYHGCNSGSCSWYEFAQEIFRAKGLKVDLQPIAAHELERPARRPARSLLINTKLPPQRSWQEALREFLNNLDA